MTSKHQIEQEIKLTAPNEATLDRLINSPIVRQASHQAESSHAPRRFAATYYDTPDWALRNLRWSLRTRYEEDHLRCTLKRNSIIKNGYSSCEEIEQAATKELERIDCTPAGKISDALLEILPAPTPLLKRVEVAMVRRMRILEINGNMLELVTDAGTIYGNGETAKLYEVELELLHGDMHDHEISRFTRQLIKHFALQPSQLSKHQIGLGFY